MRFELSECKIALSEEKQIEKLEHEDGVNILTKWTESGKNFIVKLLNV